MAARIPVVVFGAAMVAACSGGGSRGAASPTAPTPAADAGGPLMFTASPIDVGAIRYITPLGNLNPPAHALPTDHIYFYFADPARGEMPEARRTSFFAPAGGTIVDVFTNAGIPDVKVYLRANATVNWYIDHLIPDVPLARGAAITAGQRLGTSGSAYGIDLGVVNQAITLGFVNPARYASGDTLHADAPLKYFSEPLRSTLYALVQRLGDERDGKIDYDVAGRLGGNWFGESGDAPLAFVYDTYDPQQVRLSLPGTLAVAGVFAIGDGEPRPRDVSPASGVVRYTLRRATTGPVPPLSGNAGTLLVQMLGDTRLQAEAFAPGAAAVAFTSGARTFVR